MDPRERERDFWTKLLRREEEMLRAALFTDDVVLSKDRL